MKATGEQMWQAMKCSAKARHIHISASGQEIVKAIAHTESNNDIVQYALREISYCLDPVCAEYSQSAHIRLARTVGNYQ